MGWARHLVVTGVVALLAACGGDDDADIAAVERDLARAVEQQTGTRDVAVDCADDVAEGDVCDVTAAGGVRAQVRVTRLPDDGAAEGQVVQP